MNSVPFGVDWIDGETYYQGRKLLDYEVLHRPRITFSKDGKLKSKVSEKAE